MIKVGAGSEVEMKEKKARVEDALHATRAAVEEGVVPGGGVALIRALEALTDLKGDNADQDVGIAVLRRAVEAPLRQIAANTGDEPSVVVNEVKNGKGNFGYNAATGEYGDMIEMGILDPTKVTRSALQAASSIGGLILTTEAAVADAPKKDGGCWRRYARHGRHGWHGRHDVSQPYPCNAKPRWRKQRGFLLPDFRSHRTLWERACSRSGLSVDMHVD